MRGKKKIPVKTETIEGIPLFLIPRIIADQIRKQGETILRILVSKKFRHNYTIEIEILDEPAAPVPPDPLSHNDGEKVA